VEKMKGRRGDEGKQRTKAERNNIEMDQM